MIIDITEKVKELLKIKNINLCCFNNGLLKTDNLEIIICRVIYHKDKIHPWQIWNVNNSLIQTKYPRQLGQKMIHKLENKIHNITEFYDGTAMIIYKNDELIFVTNKLFGEENNQDTRILLNNNEITLTYTGYTKIHPVMLQRNIYLDNRYLYLSGEKYMDENYSDKTEKNWILHDNLVHYSVDGNFIILNKINESLLNIQNIKQKYNKNIFFSQGTPFVGFENEEYLAVGHCKIDYRKKYCKDSQFEQFRERLNNFKDYKMHGKFIYFMFFYTFKNNTIKRFSYPFIFKDYDSKYLLVFPISIIKENDFFVISYGDGDISCKYLILDHQQIENLLWPIENITYDNLVFNLFSGA